MKIKHHIYKTLVTILVFYLPLISFSQIEMLNDKECVIFPNWNQGDEWLVESFIKESTVENGDTTSIESLTSLILSVREKTNKYYKIRFKPLDDQSLKLIENREALENTLSNNLAIILDDNIYAKGYIDCKLDKWGNFIEAYDQDFIDTLKYQIADMIFKEYKSISLQPDTLSFETFDKLFTSEEIQQQISQTTYNNFRVFFDPYDLKLPINSTSIDTLDQKFDSLKTAVPCEQIVTMSYDTSNINIEINYTFLINEKDNKAISNEDLNEFSFSTKFNYTVDYHSKWIKKFTAEFRTKENDKISIDKSETIFKSVQE